MPHNSYAECIIHLWVGINTLRPRRNEQHFADDIFKRIFFKANVWISIKISLQFVPRGPINNIPALVQIMAWRRSGDKPLSELIMVSLPTHICVTRAQWVNSFGRVMHICVSKNWFRQWFVAWPAPSHYLKVVDHQPDKTPRWRMAVMQGIHIVQGVWNTMDRV